MYSCLLCCALGDREEHSQCCSFCCGITLFQGLIVSFNFTETKWIKKMWYTYGFLRGSMVKFCLPMQETEKIWIWSLGKEDPLAEEMAIHSRILAWKILWTEKPGGLQSKESQRMRHNWATKYLSMCTCFIYSVKYCSAIKGINWVIYRTVDVARDCHRVEKIRKVKQILYISIYMWNQEKWYRWTYLQGRSRDSDIEKNVWTHWGKSGMNWESSINIHTLPYVKEKAGGNLLYSTGNLAWCSVVAYSGGMRAREWRSRRRGDMYCCWCSVTQLFLTLCDSVDCSTPGLPVPQHLPSLHNFMFISSVMMSSHPILWCLLLLLPSIFPSIKDFTNELSAHIRCPKYWSFSFSNSPSSEYSGLISLKIDWFDLLAVQGTFRSLLQHQFQGINFLAFCLLYSPALTTLHDDWEDHSLDYTDLCQQSNISAFQHTV